MNRRTYDTTSLLIGALLLTACPGDDTPAVPDGTTGDESTDGPPTTLETTVEPTTVDPDTTPDPDSTSGDPPMACEPECPEGECCIGGSCFSSPAPACNPGCGPFESCLCPEGSDPCTCVAECVVCGVEGGVAYDPCLDVACPDGSVCVVDDPGEPTFAWCAQTGCGDDDCACPVPSEGTATPGCGSFDGDAGDGSCFLDCSEGDAECPEGMICRTLGSESACVWPGENIESDCCLYPGGTTGCDDPSCEMAVCDVDAYCCDTEWDDICVGEAQQLCGGLCPIANAQPQYGDCLNVGDCDLGLTCISDAEGTFGWCSTLGCADDTVCQPPPATGDAPAVCVPINASNDACVLDCSGGQTCPDGMECFDAFVCVWAATATGPGYDPCILPGGCGVAQECLDDPSYDVCAQQGCVDAGDCTLDVPATGNAPVACGDPTGSGSADSCYLDCSAAQTCPDGMECFGTLCAWPQGAELFADDFESGDLSAGWTLQNVDGLTPDAGVAFVNAAWVVDEIDAGNLSAVSTSWYLPPGMSDDWLISPQIMLGADTRIYWVSRSFDDGFPDDLEVRISTATNAVADFLANPVLFTAAPETVDYAIHYIDLAAEGYANEQVYIAFRNTTFDGNLLLVDNVLVVETP
jgi:hypothetical protein